MKFIKNLISSSVPILFLTFNLLMAQSNWDSRVSGTTENLININKCNDRFIAVGEKGTILSSINCHSWSNNTSGTGQTLNSVCYGNGLYVAVGDSGTIITSTDAITWDNRISGTKQNLKSVVWGNNLFITFAQMDTGVVFTSGDGVNWSRKLVDSAEHVYFKTAVFAINKFLLAGNDFECNGSMAGCIRTFSTSDGINWTNKQFNADSYATIETLIWTGSEYVASTYTTMTLMPEIGICSSPDNNLWIYSPPLHTPFICISMVWGGSGCLGINPDNSTILSADGISWKIIGNNLSNSAHTPKLKSIIWSGSEYIGVGDNGIIYSSKPETDGVLPEKNHTQVDVSEIHIFNNSFALRVQSPTSIQMSVLNLQGKLLYETKCNLSSSGMFCQKITPSLGPGVYFARIKTPKSQTGFKFIINN